MNKFLELTLWIVGALFILIIQNLLIEYFIKNNGKTKNNRNS